EPPARTGEPGLALARTWHAGPSPVCARARPPHEAAAEADAGSVGVPVRLRRARAQLLPPRTSVSPGCSRWPLLRGSLRAGRVDDRSVRWQLQLARSHLVTDQFSAHRVAEKVSPLLRRRFSGGVSHGIRAAVDAAADRERAFRTTPAHLRARRRRS